MDRELSNDQKLAETATPNKHTQVSRQLTPAAA